MTFRPNSLWRLLAAFGAACGTVLSTSVGLAHDNHDHAAHMAAASNGAAKYQRSMRSYSIPDVALVDADGKAGRLRDLLATQDPVMLNFIFTTCGAICPVMSKVFSEVPGSLGAQAGRLRMVSISIDPENDTPAQLKSYAGTYGADARWTFLTGRIEDVKAVQLAFDSYRGDKMSHEPLTLLHPAPDHPWVRIDGFASAKDLAQEFRKVVKQ
jgi:protein SCO1/2